MRSIKHFKTRKEARKEKKRREKLEKQFRQWGYYAIWQRFHIHPLANGQYSLQVRRFRRPRGAKTRSQYPPRRKR